MEKKVVIVGKKEEEKELYSFAKNKGWNVIKTIQTQRIDSFTLFNVRLMAKYREYDYLLIKNFEAFLMPPDEMTEEVRYLTERQVKIETLEDGALTQENIPTFFRNRFKVSKGGKTQTIRRCTM